jgi:TnpA family transposase
MRLSVERLDALEVPESVVELRRLTAAMLPRIDLPELLLEVHAWTGFLHAYVHVSGEDTRMSDLPISVAALLIAEACNVGLIPMIDPDIEALTRGRLSHVDQNYLRADTHAAANALLIAAQAQVPIAQLWGGLLASVDGLRFVVPVRTLNAGPSPKYFGHKRGLTWLNDQVSGIGAQIVPGTPRDSLHILDVLLNLDAGPKPELIATDEASYSDMVFGVFSILGYRFSPRIADIGDTRYWRASWPADPEPDYGPLNAIARNKVNLGKITAAWPDMLRVAGSLVIHQVRAYDVLRMLRRDGHPTPLGQAFAEYGRIAKTLHLLAMIDPVDDTHRRTVNTQTTIQESRHRLARKIFHGKRGALYQKYREGQEDQLGALGIVLNAATLWNTRYLHAIVQELRAQGHPVLDEDAARLSPLGHAHLNELGRYRFPVLGPDAGLRPLRDPHTAEEEA